MVILVALTRVNVTTTMTISRAENAVEKMPRSCGQRVERTRRGKKPTVEREKNRTI